MTDLVDKASAWDAPQNSFDRGYRKGLEEAAKVVKKNCGSKTRGNFLAAAILALGEDKP